MQTDAAWGSKMNSMNYDLQNWKGLTRTKRNHNLQRSQHRPTCALIAQADHYGRGKWYIPKVEAFPGSKRLLTCLSCREHAFIKEANLHLPDGQRTFSAT